MRFLEFFLLLANVLAVLALLFPLPKPVRWMPQLALVALLLAGAQALVEGPRWQMVPAYALAGMAFLVWARRRIAPRSGRPTTPQPTRRLVRGWAIGLSSMG